MRHPRAERERTGYAYTDNLNPERLLHAARTAALIASGPAKQPVQGFTETRTADLYPVPLGGFDLDLAARLELIMRADRAARATTARDAGAGELLRRIAADSDCGVGWDVCQRHAAALPDECVRDRQRRRGDDEGVGGRRRPRGLEKFRGRKVRNIWRRRRRAARSCNWARWRRRRAKWKWCWGRAGREFCCMKPWGTAWKRTSIARGRRRLRD